ncbi:MAG TPA: fasciclin domain-containing protein [Nocardioidaceae bacterium]|nr:fasciclin domain-containing protein [Nocardioidaceae bacterium]
MNLRNLTSAFAALVLTGSALGVAAAPAQADDEHDLGKRSLATVLGADGNRFDRNAGDFDILDRAVRTVLKAKPESPVGVLADGKVALTAFAPTDQAFRRLVEDISGEHIRSERRVFGVLARTAGVDTVETVLLYHVVPGATITYRQAKTSNGARLETATGQKIRVMVPGRVILADADKNDRNPRVIFALRNINKGNEQIAHGIDRVLRPIDLP